jgi:hypothetical protein
VIILSGVLVVLAIALLVTGIVTGNTGHEIAGLDGLKLIYVSIGVSIISALCLAIGVFLRRKELFGSVESETSAKRSAVSRSRKTARQAKAKARVGAGDEAPVPVASATATDVPADTSVFVVPGRKRYHLETCRQLAGRDKEELTFVEAREEGFTACTACLPDTALAARAALTETESATSAADDDARPTESLEALPDTAELRSSDDTEPATRTDLPVTRLDDDEPEPAAESPAAAEAHESSEGTSADTAGYEDLTETSDGPSARSRSLFEPLDHDEAEAAAEERDDDAAATEPAEPEDASVEPAEPEDLHASEPEPETSEPADAFSSEDEPAAEPDDAAGTATEDEDTEHEAEANEAGDDDRPEATDDDAGREEATGDGATSEGLPFVRILSGTKRYHRPDCALIEDIAADADDLETLSPAEAKERGCTPCLVCQPDKDLSDDRY